MHRCWAVVPAAGVGSRMASDTPKQYLVIGGKTLLEHSVLSLLQSSSVAKVVVALHADDTGAATLPVMSDPKVRAVTGGAQRSDSVLAGLNELQALGAGADDWVLVHDAARPGLRTALVEQLITRVASSNVGGILALPITDTVKQDDGQGCVKATLDRSSLWRAQTPQMFRLGELMAALEAAAKDAVEVTDEAAAMERAGHPVQLINGEPGNLKVTKPADLALAAFYLDNMGREA